LNHALDSRPESSSIAEFDSTTDQCCGIDSKNMRKAALYARVSSDHQQREGTIRSQVAEPRLALVRGWRYCSATRVLKSNAPSP
jgi:hypothetical protein